MERIDEVANTGVERGKMPSQVGNLPDEFQVTCLICPCSLGMSLVPSLSIEGVTVIFFEITRCEGQDRSATFLLRSFGLPSALGSQRDVASYSAW